MSLNKVILMGRLTGDPELRHTQSNKPVASFTLAVNRDYNREETDFIQVVAWNKTAEFVANWFQKGQLVAVVGRLQVRNWQDKEGNSRRSYEVVAEETHFAESKRGEVTRRPAGHPVAVPGPGEFAELSEDDDTLPF